MAKSTIRSVEAPLTDEVALTDEVISADVVTLIDEIASADDGALTDEGISADDGVLTDEGISADVVTLTDEATSADEVTSTEEGNLTDEVISADEIAFTDEVSPDDEVASTAKVTGIDEVAPTQEIASTRLALFGPPPLLEGEDPAAYDELLARVSGAVKPADILEEIWVRDYVDLAWEILRLRRLKSQLLTANVHRGLKEILDRLCGYHHAEKLSADWANGDGDAIEEVDERLANAGLSKNEVMAQTLSVKIEDVERIDRMIMNAEARRNVVLREVDRHRAVLGQDLRRASRNVEDAEFVEIEAPKIEKRQAA